MHGRWRLFRHEAGRVSDIPTWAYIALFAACMLIGIWSAREYNAVVIWPANGVLLAALLQLHRRQAVQVLVACFAINLLGNVVRGDPMPFLWINVLLNMGEVLVAALIARRLCGAALDLRRPKRLINFALLAVLPAVLAAAVVVLSIAAMLRDYTLPVFLFTAVRFITMEVLGLLIVTPALLLIATGHRFRSTAPASRQETALLVGLLLGVTALVFFQTVAPLLFAMFPFLLLVAFRTAPRWVAVSIIGVAVIAAAATVNGYGPIVLAQPLPLSGLETVPILMRQLAVYYIFLLGVLISALPVSTVMSERRRLVLRLKRRTRAAQEARRRAELAGAAKSRFLALMSHEMRTPLNSITGYAEVLARHPGMTPDARHQLDHIQRSGDALLMLVQDVLEISRGDETLVLTPLNLETLIEEAAVPGRIAAEAKWLSLDIDVRPDARVPVMGDARRLRQALHHLIGNAVKFTVSGGVTILADRIDGEILIAVTDTGPGFAKSEVHRLFKPFVQGDDSTTRAHGGAGIGLSLVKRHAQRMGGRVIADSRPGDGATFTLRLPLPLAETVPLEEPGIEAPTVKRPDPAKAAAPIRQAPADTPAPQAPAVEAASPEPGGPVHVLVVDDHPTNREVARLMLVALGCQVSEACDGDEAIDLALATPFDLILMDVRMPRVDGLAATQAIRAAGCRTPILAVTADAMPEDAGRCLAAGMDGHLPKPISHKSLYAAMERLLSPEPADRDAAVEAA